MSLKYNIRPTQPNTIVNLSLSIINFVTQLSNQNRLNHNCVSLHLFDLVASRWMGDWLYLFTCIPCILILILLGYTSKTSYNPGVILACIKFYKINNIYFKPKKDLNLIKIPPCILYTLIIYFKIKSYFPSQFLKQHPSSKEKYFITKIVKNYSKMGPKLNTRAHIPIHIR